MIINYGLNRYKYIHYNKKMNVKKGDYDYLIDGFRMFGYSQRFMQSLQDMLNTSNYDNFIENVNAKHPSTYLGGIKKVI